MAELIGCVVGFIVVFGIPYLIDRGNRKYQEKINADEFMRKGFGEDYQEKMNKWKGL